MGEKIVHRKKNKITYWVGVCVYIYISYGSKKLTRLLSETKCIYNSKFFHARENHIIDRPR